MTGGGGVDQVSYGSAFPGAMISLNDVSDSGPGNRRNDLLASDLENIVGTDGDDKLFGNSSTNTLIGGGGWDTMNGGGGNDLLVSNETTADDHQPGTSGTPDDVSCDKGDFVDADSVDALGIGCDQVAIDSKMTGTPGPDTLHAFRENLEVRADTGDDVLTGVGRNEFAAGPGNDKIRAGGSGPNVIEGGTGNDKIYGGTANDDVSPGAGDDAIQPGAGNDLVRGVGSGRDKISTGAGNYNITSKERGSEPDVVRCGAGKDKVLADKRDKVARDCEKVTRR